MKILKRQRLLKYVIDKGKDQELQLKKQKNLVGLDKKNKIDNLFKKE